MARSLFLLLLCLSAGLAGPAVGAPAEGLPARPIPFRFVTDQAHLLSEADANTLESGLRRYAANTGTQLVVVTVPTLSGRPVDDYGRALGEAWEVGQRGKNNGVVVLLAGQEHQMTIQVGAGLRGRVTSAVVSRIIDQQLTPAFKQGHYFAGLRAGLNTLMLAANPDSAPRQNPAATPPEAAAADATTTATDAPTNAIAPTESIGAEPFSPDAATAAPTSSGTGAGLGVGALLLGGLLVAGVVWLLVRLFRRKATSATSAAGAAPNFLPTRPGGAGPAVKQQAAPNFLPNNPHPSGIGGSGLGGILATGAAAAAGAYLGNRMAGGHTPPATPYPTAPANLTPPPANPPYSSGSGSGGNSEFPALAGAETADESAPDYFAPDNSAPDYFTTNDDDDDASNDTSYDDPSSDNTGGGGFDDTSNNSGSW